MEIKYKYLKIVLIYSIWGNVLPLITKTYINILHNANSFFSLSLCVTDTHTAHTLHTMPPPSPPPPTHTQLHITWISLRLSGSASLIRQNKANSDRLMLAYLIWSAHLQGNAFNRVNYNRQNNYLLQARSDLQFVQSCQRRKDWK